MKKIIFTFLALVGTMSMNAQVMKVMKNGQDTPVETYSGSDYYIVFEEAPAFPFGQGEAAATGIGNVKWIQLWENGPKFAEYNVGAANNKPEDYGGYYCWGKTNDESTNRTSEYNTGTTILTGNDDTATNLWGSKWRMPTQTELEALLNNENCTCTWTSNYNNSGKNGLLCTGKEGTAYADNSVFLPAAGGWNEGVFGLDGFGDYWSSTPNESKLAYFLGFDLYSGNQYVGINGRNYGNSIRAVLKETPATTGVAKATIGGVETDVNWVQLWDGGPKFAEYNIGASSVTETGTKMTFTEATSAEYVWGANWCTPSMEQMDELLKAMTGSEKVTCKYCEYTEGDGKWGFKFTGLTDGYTDNSVFFPAQSGNSGNGNADYWSATAKGSEAWYVYLDYFNGNWRSYWNSNSQGSKCLVRPVLKN